MKITPSFNYITKSNKQNVSFGHIYSSAVDTLRHKSDGYNFRYECDAYDDYCSYPTMIEYYETRAGENGIKTMTDAEVQKLEELTRMASSFRRSIITNNKKYYGVPADGLMLLVKDKNDQAKCISEVIFKTGNAAYNLFQLGTLVHQAKKLEEDKSVPLIKPIIGQDKYVIIDKQRNEPRYQSIYNYTICNYGAK